MARVYAVASAKGGVGKTTTTANLGTTLAMAGHDVVVVDGDLGMPNLAGALGVDPDGATLHDVLTGESAVETAVYDGPAGLSVVPGSNALEAFATANVRELDSVISALEATHDIVIIDTGAGLSDDTFVPLKLADEVVLVSTTEREALGDTEKTRQLGDRIGADVVGVVLTRVDQSNPNAEVVASLLDAGVIAVVPEDPAIREALNTQIPVVARSPDSIAAAGYRALAEALTGQPVPIPDAAADAAESEADAEDAAPPTDGDDADDGEATEPETDEHASVVPADADSAEASETVPEPETAPDSDPESTPDDVAAAAADEDRVTAEPETEPEPASETEPEPNFEPEEPPEADADAGSDPDDESAADDDLAASIPFSGDPVEDSDAPAAEPDSSPADDAGDADGNSDAVADPVEAADPDPAAPADPADPAEDDATDAPTDPLAADAADDSMISDSEPVGEEGPDTDPLAADLEAVTRGTSTADEEAVGDANDADDADDADDVVPDVDADADSAGSDPLAEDAADSESVADPTASSVSDESAEAAGAEADAPDADEPLVAEAEPNASGADADADDDDEADDGDEEGVYTTSLVEEVESFDDDERDEKKKGFFRRFLG
ncbi:MULTISPECIES: MinD/ParA family ATP-binding protein [Haloferax]|nr:MULTISPECIES: MinD/ParA family protein [Haloferax]MDS0241843.1 cell division ATPase MinD [Haloferax sp. S2CR25]MDS0444964.1 cell division ATPase MinD [Haloferax sp. S2CR25-2]